MSALGKPQVGSALPVADPYEAGARHRLTGYEQLSVLAIFDRRLR